MKNVATIADATSFVLVVLGIIWTVVLILAPIAMIRTANVLVEIRKLLEMQYDWLRDVTGYGFEQVGWRGAPDPDEYEPK